MTVAIDSWAALEWLEGNEPSYTAIEDAVTSGRPVMSWLNAAEVFYRVSRQHGETKAISILNDLRFDFDIEVPTERRVLEAAQLKAAHPIALADCFAISCAADNDATLFTGDPEILKIKGLPCPVRDLRS